MSTIKDVAQMSGVSVATVSRYINDSGYVGQKSREKIAKAIKELNFTPNEVARSLYKKTSKLIGLLVPEIDNPFFNRVIKGVENICNEHGYNLIISNVRNYDDEIKYIDSYINNNIAGIISSIGTTSKNFIDCPIVGVDRARDMYEYAVFFDEVKGGILCAEAIIQGGCKNILVNIGPEHVDVAKYRFEGINTYFKENNIKYDTYYSNSYEYDDATKLVEFIKNSSIEYDSIIACNDLHALSVSLYYQSIGKKIPDDVQIIGYDDIIYSKVCNPKLATINHDGFKLGQESANMLIDLIENRQLKEKKIELESYLVKNQSLRG